VLRGLLNRLNQPTDQTRITGSPGRREFLELGNEAFW